MSAFKDRNHDSEGVQVGKCFCRRKDEVIAAAEALSDLNTFAIVVSILEGGHLHAPSYSAAGRIIKICQAEQQKRLREYDRAMVHATARDTTE